jgi:hypothetical protein
MTKCHKSYPWAIRLIDTLKYIVKAGNFDFNFTKPRSLLPKNTLKQRLEKGCLDSQYAQIYLKMV